MVIVRGGRPRRQASTKKARDARAPARRGVPSARRHAMSLSLRGRMGARPQRPAAHWVAKASLPVRRAASAVVRWSELRACSAASAIESQRTLTRDAEGEGPGRRDVPEVGTHAEENKGGGGGDVFIEGEG
eukprot:scaffold5480_cov111-Isochrysis_galbana.AAC.2